MPAIEYANELSQDLLAMQATIRAAEAALKTKGELVPKWWMENGIPMRWDTGAGQWQLGFKVQVRIKEVLYSNWLHTPTNTKSVTVDFWLPVDKSGGYRITQLRLMRQDLLLPHVTSWSACLSIGDGPTALNSWDDITRLQRSLARGLSQINLSSLLSAKKSLWPKEVRKAVPMAVSKFIRGRHMRTLPQDLLAQYFTRIESEGVMETWTTSTLANNR